MKRFHVHAHVDDLPASVAFYSKLFGAEPARVETDYAKWMIEDPRINFAISTRGSKPGVDHLGIQTDTEEELVDLKARAAAADMTLLDVGETSCCYARSDKYWLTDPQGIAWEQFRTLGNIPVFGETLAAGAIVTAAAGAQATAATAETAAAIEPATAAAACCAPRGKPVGVAVATPRAGCC